jgi:hypothetical protein
VKGVTKMIKLVANKRFLNGGTIMEKGETFHVATEQLANEFVLRGLVRKVIEDERNKPAERKQKAPKNYVDYGEKTLAELKRIAKEKKIEGYSRMKKDALIKALNQK